MMDGRKDNEKFTILSVPIHHKFCAYQRSARKGRTTIIKLLHNYVERFSRSCEDVWSEVPKLS